MLPPNIEQKEFSEFAEQLGTAQWVTLYQDFPMNSTGIAICTLLVDPEKAANYVQRADWYEDCSRSRPSFNRRIGDDGSISVEYERFGNRYGAEPIVLLRSFVGGWKSNPEVTAEFRLLFNLHEEPDGSGLAEINEVGDKQSMIRVTAEGVQVRRHLLHRYLAARQKALIINVLSDVWEECSKDEELVLPPERTIETDNMYFEFWATDIWGTPLVSSRWLGQKVVLPPPIEESGIWPFDPEPMYEEFIVDADDQGRYIIHTCDPRRVPSGISARTRHPQKLTPVFFRKEVLTRYFADPTRYDVGPSILRDRDAWLLRMDNDHSDHVAVFLGDLGTDLPHSEQEYWKAFNIPPDDRRISEAAFRTSILAEFANANRSDHRFKRVYKEASQAWNEKHGWPLFKELNDQDRHVLTGLRLPLTNSAEEFDNLVVKLAKLLVDSLNDEAVKRALSGAATADEKSIARLERYLRSLQYPYTDRDTGLLRTIQGIRSKGSAHRRGSDFDLAKAGLDPNDLAGSFERLIEQAILMLEDLIIFAAAERP